MNTDWWVYIVECSDGSWYTGITKDVEQRVKNHNSKNKGAKYTRTRQPVKLVFKDSGYNRSTALKEEYRIKKLSKREKLDYVSKTNNKI